MRSRALENQRAGFEPLLKRAASFSTRPGVYLMKDDAGTVIYVGKAKNLRARVKSYFMGGDGRVQIEFLLKKVKQIDTIVTSSENEAFVLERDLITKYKPRYNIRLKDDKAYLSIRIDKNQPWPRLELVRDVQQDGALYFGPYTFSYELKSLLEIIKRVVPLRSCSDTVFYNRQRPCLEYQIRRCLGPCCLPVRREDYLELVKQAVALLEGKSAWLIKELSGRMEQASKELRFEEAAFLRDRIRILENARSGRALMSSGGEHRDVFGLYREGSLATLSVLRVRFGHVSDSVNYSFLDIQVPDAEVLEEAVSQFYEGGREIPQEIIVPQEFENLALIRDVLAERRQASVVISAPQRGVKHRLLGLAQLNAREQFKVCFDAEIQASVTLKELARTLMLKQVPRRVELVDISNLQGSDIVGAVAVFYDGKPEKQSYKKYIISFQDKADDFAAVYEVVQRRLRRGIAEGDLPDLMIIDGGPGQLAKALEAREGLKCNVEIAALAKMKAARRKRWAGQEEDLLSIKPERIYREGAAEPICLEPTQATTHLLQRMRDEVHRYVISFHRQRRSARVLGSVLAEISGLGPERRKRLLAAYGTIESMRERSAQELARAGRMPLKLARKVLARLAMPGT